MVMTEMGIDCRSAGRLVGEEAMARENANGLLELAGKDQSRRRTEDGRHPSAAPRDLRHLRGKGRERGGGSRRRIASFADTRRAGESDGGGPDASILREGRTRVAERGRHLPPRRDRQRTESPQ